MMYPGVADLTKAAFDRSGCRTHREFVDFLDGSIGIRTLRAWLLGERPASPLACMVLRHIRDGWVPHKGKPE